MTDGGEQAVAATLRWVNRAVVGLNLCPFAGPVIAQSRLRIVSVPDSDPRALIESVMLEAARLVAVAPEITETTLVVMPQADPEFVGFNALMDPIENLLDAMELAEAVQTAIFHPRFCFADNEPDDPQNLSHRSPYPSIHLLRRQSLDVDEAVVQTIIERNQRILQDLSTDTWDKQWQDD